MHEGDVLQDRYQIRRLIGRGAMANVYQAADLGRNQDVAIKVLRDPLVHDAEAVERFRREVRVQEMIQHRNVAAVYGSGVTERRRPYLIVELLRGHSLRTVLRCGASLDLLHAVSYGWQALAGLAAVHEVGVHHRDLKPANMMLQPGEGAVERVVLIDFGFASLRGAAKLTARGHVVGSLYYMAPERLRGIEGDPRSDLYSIGIVLYELLAGCPPFTAQDDFDLIHLHLEQEPEPPSQRAPERAIPADLDEVVMRALAKQPKDRYDSATLMAAALDAAFHGGSRPPQRSF